MNHAYPPPKGFCTKHGQLSNCQSGLCSPIVDLFHSVISFFTIGKSSSGNAETFYLTGKPGYTLKNSSYFTRDLSYLTRDSSCLTRDSLYLSRDSSYLTRDSLYLSRESSYLTRDSSYLTRDLSCLTRDTSYLTQAGIYLTQAGLYLKVNTCFNTHFPKSRAQALWAETQAA